MLVLICTPSSSFTSHPEECVHYGFNLHFATDGQCRVPFHKLVCLCQVSVQVLDPFSVELSVLVAYSSLYFLVENPLLGECFTEAFFHTRPAFSFS